MKVVCLAGHFDGQPAKDGVPMPKEGEEIVVVERRPWEGIYFYKLEGYSDKVWFNGNAFAEIVEDGQKMLEQKINL